MLSRLFPAFALVGSLIIVALLYAGISSPSNTAIYPIDLANSPRAESSPGPGGEPTQPPEENIPLAEALPGVPSPITTVPAEPGTDLD